MRTINESINILKSTKKYIDAYKKIGTDELITEAEKSYVYGQYDLAFEICNIILDRDKYSQESMARAYELRALIMYYHDDKLKADNSVGNPPKTAYEILTMLDSKGWEVLDSRYILGEYYAENGCYDDAIRCFKIWLTERDKEAGTRGLAEMFKHEQYDTDNQLETLFTAYYAYYSQYNIKDLLLRTAKYAEEYFPQYIHNSVCEMLGISGRTVSRIHYCDEDFALPYNLRQFDCSYHIRLYVRNSEKPSLEGCMHFLSQNDREIQNSTERARRKELEEVLLRRHVDNENTRIGILRREAQENQERFEKFKNDMEQYRWQMKRYQERSLLNQESARRELRGIKNAIDTTNSRLSRLRWW